MKDPCVYIPASRQYGTLYIGVTSDLHGRMSEHTQGLFEGFTKRYGVKRLVYYTYFNGMDEAIKREKQLKAWQRGWKIRLIRSTNPEWANLYDPKTGEVYLFPVDESRQVF